MNLFSPEVIEDAKNRLVQAYHPEKIYLFGSYAWGTPDEASDLDFLVVVDSSNEKFMTRAIAGHHALWELDILKDIVVYTQAEFELRLADPASFASKVKREGKVLYARG